MDDLETASGELNASQRARERVSTAKKVTGKPILSTQKWSQTRQGRNRELPWPTVQVTAAINKYTKRRKEKETLDRKKNFGAEGLLFLFFTHK